MRSLCSVLLPLAACGACLAQTLAPTEILDPPPSAQTWFGWSIDVDGDWMVVGNPPAEQVFFYQRSPHGWVLRDIERGSPSDAFGISVAISGRTCAVAAYSWPFTGDRHGKVSIYERHGTQWSLVDELLPPELYPLGFFGISLSLDSEAGWLAIGAQKYGDEVWERYGIQYLAQRDPQGDWEIQQELPIPWTPEVRDGENRSMGNAVSLRGAICVAGAWGGKYGAAYVFERDANDVWSLRATLTDSNPSLADTAFGYAVSTDGDRVAIGQPRQHGGLPRSGRCFVYETTGAAPHTWTLAQVLSAPNPQATDDFGEALAIDGDRLYVGNRLTNFPSGPQGAVHEFVLEGPGWVHRSTLRSSEVERIGFAVATSQGTVVTTTADFMDGFALSFDPTDGTSFCPGALNSVGTEGLLSVVSFGDRFRSSVRGLPGSTWFSLYGAAERDYLPFGDGILCLGSTATRLGQPALTSGAGLAHLELQGGLAALLTVGSGARVYLQAIYSDPDSGFLGYNTTNAVELRPEATGAVER